MDWFTNDQWTAISGYLGVLGFLLSVALAINEIMKNRVRIDISNIYYAGVYSGALMRLYLDFTLTNRSRMPVSITSAAVLADKDVPYPAHLYRTTIMGMTNKTENSETGEKVVTGRADILTTAFPVNLSGEESTCIRLCVRFDHPDLQSQLKSVHLPQADNPELLRYIHNQGGGRTSQNTQEEAANEAKRNQPWSFRVSLSTFGKPVQLSDVASFRAMSYYWDLGVIEAGLAENQV